MSFPATILTMNWAAAIWILTSAMLWLHNLVLAETIEALEELTDAQDSYLEGLRVWISENQRHKPPESELQQLLRDASDQTDTLLRSFNKKRS